MTDIKVPELAESISEASIDTWEVKVGDQVKAGQALVGIETDKVLIEIPAPTDGVIASIIKKDGEDVGSEEVIGTIEAGGSAAAAPAAAAEPAAAPASAAPAASSSEPPVSPAARRLAADSNVDLGKVAGSGKDGRITKADVEQAAGKAPAPAAAPAAAAPAPAAAPAALGARREKMSKLRARVAARLLQSQQEAAILTTFNEVDMSAVIGLRQKHRDQFEKVHGVKLGFMSFFVKAATAALQQYPIINAGIDGDDIVHYGSCDIGIAVGSPRGLVVPVLRSAESMGMAKIESSIADFGQRARSGSLGVDELTGGTFTITNGGVFGSMLSTPIINPPQSAILGVHATKERPVAIDGQVVIRPMNYLALSYDHRLIDGREAVLFLVAIKNALEEPARMLLDV